MIILRAVALAAALFAAPVLATTVFTQAAPTGQLESPGSVSFNFTAPAGTGSATFDINGFASLDGVNCCTDTFTLNLNGTDIYSASFALGGGGTNTVFFAPVGATQTVTEFSFLGGGVANLFVPLSLLSGNNTLTFSYTGSGQGLGDEAWGLSNLSVSAVPEPESWAMLIAGFGLVGAAARRRSRVVAA